MTIILFTDASCKDGASCWAYRSTLDTDVVTGIELTANIAAMETLAIVRGLESIPIGSRVLVVSDFLSAVNIINNYRQKPYYAPVAGCILYEARARLKALLKLYIVEAIWVPSKCTNMRHCEVDQASKIMLQEYLKQPLKSLIKRGYR